MDDEQFTYASLRKLERLENTQPRLQALEGRFWVRLGEHVAKIRQAFHEQQEEDPTNRRTVVLADELRNTYRLAESIWSLREKKVVQAALAASRRSEGRLDPPENSTVEERHLWEQTLKTLSEVRVDVLRTAMPRQGQPVEPTAIQQAAAQAGLPAAQTHAHQAAAPVEGTMPAAPAAASGAAGEVPSVPSATSTSAANPSTAPASAQGDMPADGAAPVAGSPPPSNDSAIQRGEANVGQDATSGDGRSGSPEGPPQAAVQTAPLQAGAGMGGDGEHEVELRLVAALKDVPMFTGLDMVDYELREGEVGNVPLNAARILESRGLVRILESGEAMGVVADAPAATN